MSNQPADPNRPDDYVPLGSTHLQVAFVIRPPLPGRSISTSKAARLSAPCRASASCGRKPLNCSSGVVRPPGSHADLEGKLCQVPAFDQPLLSLPGRFKPGEVIWIDPEASHPAWPAGDHPHRQWWMVLYVDDTTVTVMTPEWSVSGWNSFSTTEEDGAVVAQVESFDRPSDPIYEFGFRLMGGSPQQDAIWVYVLERLAEFYGVKGQVKPARC